jgi:hypothetical protein
MKSTSDFDAKGAKMPAKGKHDIRLWLRGRGENLLLDWAQRHVGTRRWQWENEKGRFIDAVQGGGVPIPPDRVV